MKPCSPVTAPVAGITGRMLRSEGSLITAGQESSLLTTINQVNPIWVRFSLSESERANLPGAAEEIDLLVDTLEEIISEMRSEEVLHA